MRVCSVSGCPNIFPRTQGSRCPIHKQQADLKRGSSTQRGYTSKGHQRFRTAVLTRDPICVLCNLSEATVADHFPHSRKDLTDLGLDPNSSQYGRGLCKHCHDSETAHNQPGGWNNRPQ